MAGTLCLDHWNGAARPQLRDRRLQALDDLGVAVAALGLEDWESAGRGAALYQVATLGALTAWMRGPDRTARLLRAARTSGTELGKKVVLEGDAEQPLTDDQIRAIEDLANREISDFFQGLRQA